MHQSSEQTAAQPHRGESSRNGHAHALPGTRLRALLVDSPSGSTVRDLLARTSCIGEIIEVSSPAEALGRVRSTSCQVILLDMSGHDIDALGALAQAVQGVPVIALIDHEGDPDIQALRAGAEECLALSDLDVKTLQRAILHSIERKAAENNLRISEARFRALFEQSPNPICIHRSDGLSIEVNQAVLDSFRMTREQAARYNVLQDAAIMSQPGVSEAMERAFEGEATTLPPLLFSSDEHGWTDTPLARRLAGTGYPIKDDSGTVQEIALIWDDITAQEEAEKLLQASEEQYRAVFEASTDGLAIADLTSGILVQVNPAFAQMHGYTREEMVGLHPSTFVHPDDYEVQAGFMERTRRGERAYARGRDLRKDGSEFFIEVHGDPFTYNNRPHVLAVMRDVTERVIQEQQLRAKEEQYRAIFEATSDGLVIADLDGNVLEVNPAFAAMEGYTRQELVGMDPRQWIHPSGHAALEQYLEQVRAGQTYSGEGLQVRKDGTIFHAEVRSAPFIYNGKGHTLAIIRDITERVMHRELLEQRVEERTRELSTLLEVSSNVATLELELLLSRILEQLLLIADYDRASITVDRGPAEPVVVSAWGSPTREPLPVHVPVHVEELGVLGERLQRGECVIIPDLRANDPTARIMRGTLEGTLTGMDEPEAAPLRAAAQRERSMLVAPLNLKGRVMGGLILRHNRPDYYTERHAELARAIANQAAVAIENARLYQQAVDNARKTAALAQVASRVAFGGSLTSTLSALCGHIVGVSGALASAVMLRDPDTGRSKIVGAHGLPPEYIDTLNDMLAHGMRFRTEEAFDQQRPVVLEGVRDLLLGSEACAPLHPFMRTVPWDTILALPMISRDTPVGILLSYHAPAARLGEAELTFHSMIADQAAVAVENSHLLAEAHDKARLEERQRLARELHDSVTQALFSTNLIARSLEVMLEREGGHSKEVMDKMADLRQLTNGAMAEMRALIFELRPGALEEEGLLEALRKHAAGVAGREVLRVDVALTGEGELPRLKPAAEEALYRIAQEALHNVVKHARASAVQVSVGAEESTLVLRVRDNGLGFDPDNVPPGHLGLGTMGQRAQALRAEYRVESTPGQGTCIQVSVPLADWRLNPGK